jgi:hypothetical protein
MSETAKKPKAPAKPRKAAGKEAAAKEPAAKKATVTAISAPKIPSHHEVAELAHRYWIERGRHDGNHVQDWLRAEEELRGKAS